MSNDKLKALMAERAKMLTEIPRLSGAKAKGAFTGMAFISRAEEIQQRLDDARRSREYWVEKRGEVAKHLRGIQATIDEWDAIMAEAEAELKGVQK